MLTGFDEDTSSIIVLVGGANEFSLWPNKTPQTFSFPNARSLPVYRLVGRGLSASEVANELNLTEGKLAIWIV